MRKGVYLFSLTGYFQYPQHMFWLEKNNNYNPLLKGLTAVLDAQLFCKMPSLDQKPQWAL